MEMMKALLDSASFVIILVILVLMYACYHWKHIACRRYCKSDVVLTGKTVIVTGSNSGIGKATALDLARRGARVILACRSLYKAEDAAREIRTRTGNSEVVVRHLDLASLQSIREFAKQINKEEDRLDILINNAGIAIPPGNDVTQDNFPLMFGANHFGHFLLTLLLLDLLKKSAPCRVVTVSSNVHAHVLAPLDLTREDIPVGGADVGALYPHLNTYQHSKLANVLFSRELARRVGPAGVVSVSLHPGFIYTGIWKKIFRDNKLLSPLYYILSPFIWLFCLDEETGAQTSLHCALHESVPALNGHYFTNCEATEPSAMARDDALAQRLWEVSCHATGIDNDH